MRLFKKLLLCLLLLQVIICMPETGSRAKSLSAGKWEKGRKFHVPIKEIAWIKGTGLWQREYQNLHLVSVMLYSWKSPIRSQSDKRAALISLHSFVTAPDKASVKFETGSIFIDTCSRL